MLAPRVISVIVQGVLDRRDDLQVGLAVASTTVGAGVVDGARPASVAERGVPLLVRPALPEQQLAELVGVERQPRRRRTAVRVLPFAGHLSPPLPQHAEGERLDVDEVVVAGEVLLLLTQPDLEEVVGAGVEPRNSTD